MADEMNKEREAAEQWLRDRYGAYRGHFAWRELEEAFLAGRASLAASAGSEPVKRVFLVHTGEEHEGEATYTRHDDAPPPLCDSECLYTHPSPPEGMAGMVPVAEVVECEKMGQQALREIDGRWRWLSIGERLYARADTGIAAAPTPAAQGDAVLRNALQLAVDHIDMEALSISHCKDAEAIRAALAQKEGK